MNYKSLSLFTLISSACIPLLFARCGGESLDVSPECIDGEDCKDPVDQPSQTLEERRAAFLGASVSEQVAGYTEREACEDDFPRESTCGDFGYSTCGIALEIEAERL